MFKAAISQVWYDNAPEIHGSYGPFMYGLNHCYPALFDRPDLLPLAVLPVENVSPEDILKDFDMLVLTGGGDPSPSLFGRTDNGSRNPQPFRSSWDIKLYHAARELDIPIFGICLGIQIIGIAEGVALIQDIETLVESADFHDGSAREPVMHNVNVFPGTRLRTILGEHINVSTFHHQVLEKVPPGFLISAQSSDGLIEAIESEDGRVIGVQWHPERDSTGVPILEYMMRIACRT